MLKICKCVARNHAWCLVAINYELCEIAIHPFFVCYFCTEKYNSVPINCKAKNSKNKSYTRLIAIALLFQINTAGMELKT